MTLRDEIINYLTFDGFVSPHPIPPGTLRSCDNHLCFTSEYYIILKQNGLLTEQDKLDFTSKVKLFMSEPGLITRFPGDKGNTPPDDMLGLLAACSYLGLFDLGQSILDYGLNHFGSFNPTTPGKWTSESFIWRQPQLIAAAYAASGRKPWYTAPLWAYSALVIAISCLNVDKVHSDPRRLGWLLIQCVAPRSWLCRQASKLWYSRLFKDYGPNGMRQVSGAYYKPEYNNPFCRWWMN